MFRPYLAILKDSFREALASRILWILIIFTTVVLLLAGPIGLKEEQNSRLRRNSVRNWPRFVARVAEQAHSGEPSPGRQIWSRFSSDLKRHLAKAESDSPGEIPGDLANDVLFELNQILDDRTFCDSRAWQETEPGEEAQKLLQRGAGTLSGDETARLNRLLLEAAYPGEITRERGGDIYLAYLVFKVAGPLELTRSQITLVIKAFLARIINIVVGAIGVLGAILVTAPIIPQTFEPGAIDLLLSKPVSRVSLFLTKFVGGCAFIGVNAAYVIVGLWLIAGLRFDIWSNKLFLCIPVILFLFAVYYSVSALAGVLWRNAIVSVFITIIFWGLCVGVWGAKELIETWWINPHRLVKLIPASQTLVAVTEPGLVESWRPQDATWEEVFPPENPGPRPAGFILPRPMIGPIYDPKNDRLAALAPAAGGGGFGMFGPSTNLAVGYRKDAWIRKKGPPAPAGAFALFADPHGDLVAVSKAAVFRLAGTPQSGKKTAGKGEKFVRLGPEPALRLDSWAVAAMHPDSGAVATFSRGTVTVIEPDDSGKYIRRVEKEIDAAKDATAAVLAYGGQSVLLALADGRVLILGAADLELQHELRPMGDHAPRFAAASPGGRWFSLLFHNHRLWLYDALQSRPAGSWFTGQGDISAAAFDGADHLLVADRGTRVTRYRLEPFREEENRAPELTGQEATYYYGLVPLYTVLPRQGELGEAVKYLLDEKETRALDPTSQNLALRQTDVDLAGPIWSSLAFLTVMLCLACLYVWRADF